MKNTRNFWEARSLSRRTWLVGGIAAVTAGLGERWHTPLSVCANTPDQDPAVTGTLPGRCAIYPTPTFSVTPVVGDGRWIWREPPAEGRGCLEPREFDLVTTIRWTATGDALQLIAGTVIPSTWAEQEILSSSSSNEHCESRTEDLGVVAGQLVAALPRLTAGQVATASLRQRLRLYKSYFAYERDHFPNEQRIDPELAKPYLVSSPGIRLRHKALRELATTLVDRSAHPWDKARAYFDWTRANIQGKIGAYTSVEAALKNRVGDCEELAAVFIALCRVSGIPARLVWVPNHAWAEFYLLDHDGTGHWIPAHTAAYPWFGWTGAHEVVLQKGDRVHIPETDRTVRLLGDWHRWVGARPQVEFTAELTPVGDSIEQAGPGARRKQPDGRWTLVERHSADRWMRDG